MRCVYCGQEFKEENLRPYAEGGEMTCARCAMVNVEVTAKMFLGKFGINKEVRNESIGRGVGEFGGEV
jgi:hypothetical protein